MSATLKQVVDSLEAIAPTRYTEDWDNVGLLVEPTKPKRINRALLTIDLTEAVVAEAIDKKAELIVSYHPPIFDPLKRITASHWKQRIVAQAIEKRIAVYAPHTALDAAPGGVNDWLADGLGARSVFAIEPYSELPEGQQLKLVVFVPAKNVDDLRKALSATCCAGMIGAYEQCSFSLSGTGTFKGDGSTNPAVGKKDRLETVDEVRLEMVCSSWPYALQEIERTIRETHPYEEPAWDLYPLAPKAMEQVGQGRDVALAAPVTLNTLVGRIKKHLGLKKLRLAAAEPHRKGKRIDHVLLCAGAGGSVLSGRPADVYLTGEMRHHDVLEANARGISVVLCDHTNTERGYLPTYRGKIRKTLGGKIDVIVSRRDREPLEIV